jgi:hypothetical protein
MKIIFGYLRGAYISIPNFGLVNESTIPEHRIYHHRLIGNVTIWVYIVSIVLLEIFM